MMPLLKNSQPKAVRVPNMLKQLLKREKLVKLNKAIKSKMKLLYLVIMLTVAQLITLNEALLKAIICM